MVRTQQRSYQKKRKQTESKQITANKAPMTYRELHEFGRVITKRRENKQQQREADVSTYLSRI